MKKPPPPPEPPEYSDDDLFGRWADKADGMETVNGHTPAWYQCLHNWAFWEVLGKGEIFKGEDLRYWCGDPPNSPQAYSALFGAEIRKAKKLGLVAELRDHGYSSRRTSHGCDAKFYRPLSPEKEPAGVRIDYSSW